MPLQATSGAASYDGFGGGAAAVPQYIEDVFSCFLYAGTGPSAGQTITNNIDLSTKGGMTWIKDRTDVGTYPTIIDTVRGATKELYTNQAVAQGTVSNGLTAFTTSGFTLGTDTAGGNVNYAYSSPSNFVSWTFRKQPKFFDVVTWTGDGTNNRAITHSLGSVPGCIIVKNTSSAAPWAVKHRSLTASQYLVLNDTAAPATSLNPWSTNPTSSVFYVNGSSSSISNGTGSTYVAYIFAHDSGGFGLTGTDNVISCSSVTTDGSGNATVNLGYEPQFVMIKSLDAGEDWNMVDTMRGLAVSNGLYNGVRLLKPNQANAESSAAFIEPSSTGFKLAFFAAGSQTYIYIAIRRGPMKVPTSGTSVFTPAIRTGDGTTSVNVTNATFPVDLAIGRGRSTSAATPVWIDRLRGATVQLRSDNSDAEAASTIMSSLASQTGWIGSTGGSGSWNTPSVNYIQWYMRRAPNFFDEVCYTGTGSATTFTHNLGVVPELIIVKARNRAEFWICYQAALGNAAYVLLNSDGASSSGTYWNNTSPTSSVFSVSGNSLVGGPYNYVAYLFATCSGVSKVGSYTGTGTTKQIDCGFTAGARFVLIKRTDSTGDWYVWDTARGIVSGNDPYLLINSTAAEVTSTDYIDTYSAGFEISSTAPAAINASGGSFIFLAIS